MPLNHDRLAGLKFDAQLPRDRNEIDTVREVDQLLDLAPLEVVFGKLEAPKPALYGKPYRHAVRSCAKVAILSKCAYQASHATGSNSKTANAQRQANK